MTAIDATGDAATSLIDSRAAWRRLAVSLLIATIGGVGMWSVVVVLPAVQTDFGITRADASFAYTVTMLGFGAGSILMGRLADRVGIFPLMIVGGLLTGAGYFAAGAAMSITEFAIAHGLMIGFFGNAVYFAPLVADVSLWFRRRRGIAVAIVASGNYLAGTFWPPIVERAMAAYGWRETYVGIGLFCLVTLLPLTLGLRRRAPVTAAMETGAAAAQAMRHPPVQLNPNALQALLMLAGVACCIAMAMPQVHMVAYCGDLGYGPKRGAEMLALMLGFGVVSRLVSGVIADRIGGLKTLLLGSVLQAFALVLYVPFDGLMSLYVISALFGLFQGGIVPSYALIVRENFPPEQAATRVSLALTSTLVGMALGGWLSGVIFDWTGSYQAAFIHGILWNILNMLIALGLIWRSRAGTHSLGASAR